MTNVHVGAKHGVHVLTGVPSALKHALALTLSPLTTHRPKHESAQSIASVPFAQKYALQITPTPLTTQHQKHEYVLGQDCVDMSMTEVVEPRLSAIHLSKELVCLLCVHTTSVSTIDLLHATNAEFNIITAVTTATLT